MAHRARTSLLATATLGTMVLVLTIDAGTANASFCGKLQAEYASLQTVRHKAVNPRGDLALAKAQARRAGCMGGFSLKGRGAQPQCPALMARIETLLQRQAPFFAEAGTMFVNRYAAERRKSELRAALHDKGCRIPGVSVAGKDGGAFRTLCVRACDGYYFPIGYATPRSRLNVDLSVCQSLYPDPADGVDLYIHRTSQSSDLMVSLKGEPYADRPFAFAYRTAYSPACAARLRAPGSYVASLPLVPAGEEIKQVPLVVAAVRPVKKIPQAPADETAVVAAAGGRSSVQKVETGAANIRSVRTVGSASYYQEPVIIHALRLARMSPARPLPRPVAASMLPFLYGRSE